MLIESNLTSPFDNKPVEQPIGEDGQYVLNPERLDAVVEHALNADNWDQESWARADTSTPCGTSYCIAGFAASKFSGLKEQFAAVPADMGMNVGYPEVDVKVNIAFLGETRFTEHTRSLFEDISSVALGTDGSYYDISSIATAFIGLNPDEAEDLFNGDNDADDVREVARAITEGKYRAA